LIHHKIIAVLEVLLKKHIIFGLHRTVTHPVRIELDHKDMTANAPICTILMAQAAQCPYQGKKKERIDSHR